MAFDIEGARAAGYDDAEIADFLGKQSNFDTGAALKAGYSPSELIQHLSAAPAAPEPESRMEPVYDPNGVQIGETMVPVRDPHSAMAMGDEKRSKYPGRVLDKDIPPITVGSAARDIASGVMQIPATVTKGVADIARLATGDRIGKQASDESEAINKWVQKNVGSERAQAQRTRMAQDMADPALNGADVVVGNPGALADMAIPQFGSMVLPGGAAATAGKMATGTRAAKVAAAIDAETVAARANAAREAAAIGTTVAQNAADTFSTVREKGGDLDQAYLGAAITAPATYVAGRLTGGGAEAQAAKLMAGQAARKGALRSTGTGLLREGGQEMGEEGGQIVGETVGTGSEFDANAAAKRIAVAGTLGAVMGGGVDAVGHIAQPTAAQAIAKIGEAQSVDEAIAAATAAVNAPVALPEMAQGIPDVGSVGLPDRGADAVSEPTPLLNAGGVALAGGDQQLPGGDLGIDQQPATDVPNAAAAPGDAGADAAVAPAPIAPLDLTTADPAQLLAARADPTSPHQQAADAELKRRETEAAYADVERRKETEQAAIVTEAREQQADQQVAAAEAANETETPTAMAAAFERAKQKAPKPEPVPVLPAAPKATGTEPAMVWMGRRGDGYQSGGDASLALRGRVKERPDLNWKVEQTPSGTYRLAGYAQAAQTTTAPTRDPRLTPVSQRVQIQNQPAATAAAPAQEAPVRAPAPAAGTAAARVEPVTERTTAEASPRLVKDQRLVPVSRREPAPTKPLDERLVPKTKRGAVFSRGPDKARALQELSQHDDLFALPKSKADTVQAIAADTDSRIGVRKVSGAGTTDYQLTLPGGDKATISVRPHTEHGVNAYSIETDPDGTPEVKTERPGENPEDVPPTDDVWVNVSNLKRSGEGALAYSIAANYAHNTGRIFIGDPNGLSNDALRRRTEQMLSSALKFGTTEHIAPHPRQVEGDAKLGVPPLKWVYGDHAGNVERMIDVASRSLDNAFPSSKSVSYDPATGKFFRTDTGQRFADRSQLKRLVDGAIGRRGEKGGDTGGAGWRTVARNALFRALRSTEDGARGDGRDVLEKLGANVSRLSTSDHPQGVGSEAERKERLFYSRGDGDAGLSRRNAERVLDHFRSLGLKRIELAETIQDLPENGRDRIESEGIKGVRGMFDEDSDTVWLVRENLGNASEAVFVGFHEAFHRGLRKTLGDGVRPILDQIYLSNRSVRDQARAYMEQHNIGRLEATEEVLADMAGDDDIQDVKGWDKLVKFIRDFLDKASLALGTKMEWTDSMIRDLVAGARAEGLKDGVHIDSGTEASAAPLSRAPKEETKPADEPEKKEPALPKKSAFGELTPAQEKALRAVAGFKEIPTLAERAKELTSNMSARLTQGLVDQFAPIKEVSQEAYMLARLSKGGDGTMEAALMYGRPFLRDGVPDVDIKDGGFAKVLAGLKGEHDRFLWWVAAQRANSLKKQGKENLFTDENIAELRTLAFGKMADGSSRQEAYIKALGRLNEFNDAVLKMAVESGLIDQEARDLFKDQPYVPFYRVMEDEGGELKSFRSGTGLVGQAAFKKLKGGTDKINADLLQNMLMNWSHLYTAAARNRAALATMEAAEKMAIAYQVPDGMKGSVKVMREGVAEHWAVEDPYLMDAITSLAYTPSPLIKPLAKAKQWLTFSVTINPTFKVRNLIRDSLSAIAQSDLSYNPAENIAKGWKGTRKDSQTYASMLAGGGLMRFGTTENTDRVRRDIEKLGGEVLDKNTAEKLWNQMRGVYDAYAELGDRGENVNRAALYERLLAKGHTHAEAAFMSRDLMDFSMGGQWAAVRFLAQTVPFLNARLQGLYKLGRAAKENPQRFATMALAVSMASVALWAGYHDDDDWKRREDWDRDSYFWFKIGKTAYRIPKPFELGSIGTLAERTAELAFDREGTGKRFGERLSSMLFQTFSMDPVPQLFKPLLDVYSNKDSFTKRPIETMSDERLRPQDRVGERTSEVGRMLGHLGLPEPLSLLKGEYKELSPKQMDFLLRGYFSWIATVTAATTDAFIRPMMDRGARPEMRLKDMFLVGNFVESLPSGSSRYVSTMYDMARDVEQVHASYQDAIKRGDFEKAKEMAKEDGPKLRAYKSVEQAKKAVAELNQKARQIEASKEMSGERKRELLDEIEKRRDLVGRQISKVTATP